MRQNQKSLNQQLSKPEKKKTAKRWFLQKWALIALATLVGVCLLAASAFLFFNHSKEVEPLEIEIKQSGLVITAETKDVLSEWRHILIEAGVQCDSHIFTESGSEKPRPSNRFELPVDIGRQQAYRNRVVCFEAIAEDGSNRSAYASLPIDLEAVDPSSQGIKPDAELTWDFNTTSYNLIYTISLTTYNDQVIESVKVARSSLYTPNGCDDSTQYIQPDPLKFKGIVSKGAVNSQDAISALPAEVESYETRQYIWDKSSYDLEVDEMKYWRPQICVLVHYREGQGQPPLQVLHLFEEAAEKRNFEISESERLQIEKQFEKAIDRLNLTPLGRQLVLGECGLKIEHYIPEDGDLTFFWNEGFYDIDKRIFYSKNLDMSSEFFAHELLHHIWHEYLSTAQKRAVALQIDEFFSPPYNNLTEEEMDHLRNSLVFYAEYYNPSDFNEEMLPHESYDLAWQKAQMPGQHWRTDEMHSMLAALVRELPVELEEYYAQFFKDRSALVDAFWQRERELSEAARVNASEGDHLGGESDG